MGAPLNGDVSWLRPWLLSGTAWSGEDAGGFLVGRGGVSFRQQGRGASWPQQTGSRPSWGVGFGPGWGQSARIRHKMRKRHGSSDGGVTPEEAACPVSLAQPGVRRHPCCGLIKGRGWAKEGFLLWEARSLQGDGGLDKPSVSSCPPAFPRPLVPGRPSGQQSRAYGALTTALVASTPLLLCEEVAWGTQQRQCRSPLFSGFPGAGGEVGKAKEGRQGHPLVYQWLVGGISYLPVTLPGSGPGQHPWGASPCGLML